MEIDNYLDSIKNKKVAIVGVGVSHIPLIMFLVRNNINVTAFDKNQDLGSTMDLFKGLNIKINLGKDYLSKLDGFDIIFKTPGMRYDLPELLMARQNGAQITSEMEVFFDVCPAQIFGITGSDGKTTTTTLIYLMLKEQGYTCHLGGNIGNPLLSKIREINKEDKVILELSSFQLHTMKRSANISVITNITPNHLDIHKSMEEYIDAKKNIYRYHKDNENNLTSKTILNFDNEITREIFSEIKEKNSVFFSRKTELKEGAFVKDGVIVYKKDKILLNIIEEEKIALPGSHNIENILAAVTAVSEYVSVENMRNVLLSFKGVEHRIEFVRELNGIKFYNDSIASSPTRTIAGLKAFKQKVILIAGGYDKKIPYDVLGEAVADKVKCLVLIGQTAKKIEDAYKNYRKSHDLKEIEVFYCDTLEDAVNTAYKNAVPGDIVILSPASASFDMFKNFEERGNMFKKMVSMLKH